MLECLKQAELQRQGTKLNSPLWFQYPHRSLLLMIRLDFGKYAEKQIYFLGYNQFLIFT